MKKFLKVFIVVLLVVGVIAVTCYFFFKNLKERDNTTEPFASMLQSESKQHFNNGLVAINDIVKDNDASDTRIELILETSQNLDDIIFVLSTYHVGNETKINDEQISKALKEVNTSRALLNQMIDEYNIKKDSSYFNKHLGVNDFYKQASSYLVNYAKLANLMNNYLNVNKSADFKFNMFEIYSNVVIKTFGETHVVKAEYGGATKTEIDAVCVKNSSNIDLLNTHFEVVDSYVQTNVGRFSIEISNFNAAYLKCNKTLFANSLTENMSASAKASKEKTATDCFKLIYGI